MRLFLFLLVLPLSLRASASKDTPPDRELSHAYLFAPNKTYPYFERCGQLAADTPTQFSLPNAAMLAQCSMLIYVREPEFIQATLEQAGFKQTTFFDTQGTFAFATENEHHIVITFRGTETGDKTDLITDAKFHHRRFETDGRAHAGFLTALEHVSTEMQADLAKRRERSPNKKVWITGHSMGAALATLFCIQNRESIDALYAIGSPRSVNKKLARKWHEKLPIFRIVNNNDLVARIPGRPFYQHIGPTCFITAKGELIVDPPKTRLWRERLKGHGQFIEQLVKEHWSQKDFSAIPSDYFVDHSQRLYVEALIRLAEAESLPD